MKRGLLLCLLIAMAIVQALAQTRTITGKVTDARDGTPLPGVTVRIRSSSSGTLTNAKGEYSLTAPGNTGGLEFSFIGYQTRQLPVTEKGTLDVQLNVNEKALNEVVVVGYGTQERRDVTGSVGTVKGDFLKSLATPSFDKQLAGQITGVQTSVASGILGQPARIRIRGTNSITNSSDPLFVVDGIPYISGDQSGSSSVPYNPLGDINPSDIESVEVLKDGSATAIYGSRASNGVVLITTKRGKLGKPRISYDAWFAAATPSKHLDLLNADEFITITNEKLTNAGLAKSAFPTLDQNGKPYDTDWQDLVLRTGFQQSHALSFSGASEQTNYFFSLGYSNLEGSSYGNDQVKYNVRAKLEQKAFDRLTFGINMGVTHTTDNGLNAGTNALSGNIGGVIRLFPNVPAMWPDGTYNLSADNQRLGRGANTLEIDDNYVNIKYVLDHNIYQNKSLNLTGNAYVDVEILKGLNVRTQIGINYLNGEYYRYWNPVHGDGRGSNGSISQYSLPQFRYNWQNTISYNRTIGDHKIGFVAGMEYQKTRKRYFYASGTNLSDVYFGQENVISSSLGTQQIGGSVTERAFESYFARANYAFKDRYLLSATIRHDKISSLPWGSQGATLPGASIGWRISQENFFKNADGLHFISDLKIRGGYAKVGNVEIGDYPYAGIYDARQYGDLSGIQYGQMANPRLVFETSKKINVGLDLALFNDRITFTAEYFRNNLDNLIMAAPMAPSLGIPKNYVNVNIGEMYNHGWEFSLGGLVLQRGEFSWNANLNFTTVQNEVTKLANNNADLTNTYHITRVGYSVASFYGYESAGVNPANGNPLWVKADGTIIQGDINTSKYYVYDAAKPEDKSRESGLSSSDKKILGQSSPTWYGGFNNTFSYKNFDLNISLVFSGGNKIYNGTRQETLTNMKFQNAGKELLDRWTTPGQVTDVPRLYYGSGAGNFMNQNGSLSSRFLEDASFLRAQNIGLGYRFPASLLNRIKLSNLRVYAQVQNAFLLTSYKGLDPELNNSVTTNREYGLDYNTNPVPRTYTVGINVGL